MTLLIPTDWSQNPDAEVNLYPYDSSIKTYDSAIDTYDGVVPTNMADTEKVPTAWSEA